VSLPTDTSVDVLVVFHNSERFLGSLLTSLTAVKVPIVCYFLDNASKDRTVEVLLKQLENFPFRSFVFRSLRNNGFARGINLLSKQGSSKFMFVLNPDTIVEPGCIEILVSRASSSPSIGICEARQTPREHPKNFDRRTGETSWCTGAAMLIRRDAFEDVRGFDERIFFMYCEDVDLSWKLWLRGSQCIYVPEAVIQHFTQDLLPGKRRTLENYFTFRNSLFLFYLYGTRGSWRVLARFLIRRFVTGPYSFRARALYAFAFAEHLRYIPYLLQTRYIRGARQHPWIHLEETSLAD
jgi:GT2 family glycosyltransferase